MYAYDFGDDWQHVLVHEGFESADDGHGYQPEEAVEEGVRAPVMSQAPALRGAAFALHAAWTR
jgi:hypothetical protein